MEGVARGADAERKIGKDGTAEPGPDGKAGSWRGELLFLALIALTVFGLPAAIFWYDGRLASAEPGRVINLIGRNDQVDGRPGQWLVQRGTGWDYADARAPAVIRVRQGELVTLRLIAADSVHEFTLPAYGIKETVYPGDLTTLRFRAARAGEFPFLCTDYCGIGHWQMVGTLVVEPQGSRAGQAATSQAAAKGGS